jgi:hypothetical protein
LSFDELEGRTLLSTFVVINTNDSGAGSLRQAILNANGTPGVNTIAFSIASGPQTIIMPASALPAITNPVVIDGMTQPGFSGKPLIELSGNNAGANANGLTITAGNSTVRDLVMTSDASGNITGSLVGSGLNPGDTITGTATDSAGNTSEFAANVVTAGSVGLLASSTTLVSSLNPAVYGQSVTFTATVTGLGLPPLTGGSVTFLDGGTTLGTVPLSGTTADLTTSALIVGAHNITAIFGGNQVYATSTSSVLTETITPATLIVTANDATRVYGQANPVFTDTITGFVNGDTASAVSGTASLTTTATGSSGVGSYAITATQGSLSAANYVFAFAIGALAITPATLTVTGDDVTRLYGQGNGHLTATITGFVNGDTSSVLGGKPDVDTIRKPYSPVGTYAIAVDAGTLSAANYTFVCQSGTLIVIPATLTVTSNQTKVYGAAMPVLTATYSGFVNGDGPAELSGAPSLSTPATSSSGVGAYVITVGPGTLSAANYTFTFVDGVLTVTPAQLTVTADAATRIYGQANPVFTDTITGFVNGDTSSVVSGSASLTTPATISSGVGTYTITAKPGTLSAANYAFAFVNCTLTVTAATLTVTANDASKDYGQANPGFTETITGYVNGDTASVVSGAASLSTTATPASGVGGYTITAAQGTLSAANYRFALVNGTLSVSAAPLTITAIDASKSQGQPNPAFTASYNGFVNGDTGASLSGTLAFATPANTSSPAGSYSVTPGGLTSANYTINFVSGTLTVTPVSASASATAVVSSGNPIVYGQAVTFMATVSAVAPATGTPSGTVSFLDGSTLIGKAVLAGGSASITLSGLTAGSHSITVSYSGDNAFAASTSATLNQTVNAAPLRVTANNVSRVYGTGNPPFTVSYSGFVNGDSVGSLGGTLSFNTPATAASSVGAYAITPAGITSGNYAITFVDGTLTITPATLAVTTNNASKVYGTANPTLSGTVSGFVNGDTQGVIAGNAAFASTATTASGVGMYAITATRGTLHAANYTFTFQSGKLTVTPATLTVTDLQTTVYGAALPTLRASYTGFVNGDSGVAVSGAPKLHTAATSNSPIGAYAITVARGSLYAANYTFACVNGTLTITPATLTVHANDATKVYGQANPALDYAITGLVNGDTSAAVIGNPSLQTAATATSEVGTYPITVTQGSLSAANYTFAFVPGTLTITAAPSTSGGSPSSGTSSTPPVNTGPTPQPSPPVLVATSPPPVLPVESARNGSSGTGANTTPTSAAAIIAVAHSIATHDQAAANPVAAVAAPPASEPGPPRTGPPVAPPAPVATPIPVVTAPVPMPAAASPPPVAAAVRTSASTRAPSAAPVLQTEVLWGELDEFQPQIESNPASQVATAGVVTGLVATVGYLIFSARASYWLLTLLLARPLVWKRFDPMEVLFTWEREKERRRANGGDRDDHGETLQSLVVRG